MMRALVRVVLLLMAAVLVAVALAPAAMADAAGPTDYRTDIVAIEPSNAAFRVEMIGGDAFVSLEQLEPVEIIVLGYQAEPYLRFDPDGAVFENLRSPAVWLNQERYGTEDPPALYNAQARPEWSQVATDGRYAWHDHRSHWMNSSPPPSAQPGDQVLEATIPLQVDGVPALITVASYLLDGPSLLPAITGAALAVGAAFVAWRSDRRSRALIALLLAGVATLLGTIAFRSVPSVTQPSALLWVLPTVALAASLLLVLLRFRTATTVYLDGLLVAAGALLAAWGFTRFDALRRALIPSDTPASIDRLTVALALVAGAALAMQGLWGLLNPQRLPLAEAPS